MKQIIISPILGAVLLFVSAGATNCTSLSCGENEHCVEVNSTFKCEMNSSCASAPCYNGGNCSNNGSSFSCSCPVGYRGDRCEIEGCLSAPCLNGGNCSNIEETFSCSCPDRYTGERCQIDENPTESSGKITVFSDGENQATIPINESVTFEVILVIDEPFDSNLQNKQSQAFRNMRSRFLSFLNSSSLSRSETDFLGIFFNSFSLGVVADIDMFYNSSEAIPTVTEVRSLVAEASQFAPFTVKSIQVTKKGDLDRFKTWKIVLFVGLPSLFALLCFFMFCVIAYNRRIRKKKRYVWAIRENNIDLDSDLFSYYAGKSRRIPSYRNFLEIGKRGNIFP